MELVASESRFLGLSNAILLQIFSHLLERDLYLLALVSRRLYHLALPLYLSRRAIMAAKPAVEIIVRRDGLEAPFAPRLTPFIPTMTSIVFRFPWQEDSRDVIRGFVRVQRLISSLSRVEEVTLDVTSSIYRLAFSGDQLQREAWYIGFEDLCKILSSKSCSCVKVVNMDTGDVRTFTSVVHEQQARRVSRLGGIVKNITKSSSVPYGDSNRVAVPQLHFALSSILIRSPELFLSPNLRRTLATFTSLRSLTLSCIEILDWNDLFSNIAPCAPNISSIVVYTPGIPLHHLLQFASRLPRLTKFVLRTSLPLYLSKSIRIKPRLLALRKISATPKYLSVILAPDCIPPNLQSVDIYLPNLTHLNSAESAQNIAIILERLRNILLPSLTIVGGEAELKGYMKSNLDVSLRMESEYKASLALITNLTIADMASINAFDPEMYSLIFPQWLALFRTLRHLEITGYLDDSYRTLLRATRTGCPHIRTVTINYKLYDIDAMLAIPEYEVAFGTTLTFLDLPDDVLYLIFGYLTVELLSLSRLSTRLQFLALPMYLASQGMPNPTTFAQVTLAEDVHLAMSNIYALQLSHSISSIEHLHCTVADASSLFIVFEFMKRLRYLIFSLESIQKVTIKFTVAWIHMAADDIMMPKWKNLFTSLLDAILERSCVSLIVHRGLFFTPAIPISRVIADTNSQSFRSSRHLLTTLDIDSDALLDPPFLQWTISTLKHSKITHLSLTSLSYNVSELLTDVVARLLPALTNLYISGRSLKPADALNFINKLPGLKSLSMGRSLSEDRWEHNLFPASNPPLWNLKSLSAPPKFITFLLSDPGILPNLECLTVISQTSWYPVAFLAHIINHLEEYGRSPTICLDLPFFHASHSEIRVTTLLAEDSRWGKPSKMVTTLKLNLSGFQELSAPPINSPLTWLQLFPNLLHLTLDNYPSSSMSPSILREIVQTCPSLLTLHANGVLQPIDR